MVRVGSAGQPGKRGARAGWKGVPKSPLGAGGAWVAKVLLDSRALLAPGWRQPEDAERVSGTRDCSPSPPHVSSRTPKRHR